MIPGAGSTWKLNSRASMNSFPGSVVRKRRAEREPARSVFNMTDSPQIRDRLGELKNTGAASEVIESKLISIIRENCISDIPLDKKSAIKLVCNKFRLTERDARRILIALNKEGTLRFGKRRVRVF